MRLAALACAILLAVVGAAGAGSLDNAGHLSVGTLNITNNPAGSAGQVQTNAGGGSFAGIPVTWSSPCLTIAAAVANKLVGCGATTGNPAALNAVGTDTDIGITLTAQGAGVVTSASPLVAGSTLTVTTRTGTPAAFACFDAGGKLVSSATPCLP